MFYLEQADWWDEIQHNKGLFEKKKKKNCTPLWWEQMLSSKPLLNIFFSTISSTAQTVKSIIVVDTFGLTCAFLNVSLSLFVSVSQSQPCWGSWSNSPERVWRTRGPSCWKPWKRFVVVPSSVLCSLLLSALDDTVLFFLLQFILLTSFFFSTLILILLFQTPLSYLLNNILLNVINTTELRNWILAVTSHMMSHTYCKHVTTHRHAALSRVCCDCRPEAVTYTDSVNVYLCAGWCVC